MESLRGILLPSGQLGSETECLAEPPGHASEEMRPDGARQLAVEPFRGVGAD